VLGNNKDALGRLRIISVVRSNLAKAIVLTPNYGELGTSECIVSISRLLYRRERLLELMNEREHANSIGKHRKRVPLDNTFFAEDGNSSRAIFSSNHQDAPVAVTVECESSTRWPLMLNHP
jgi:hypothetical protein